MEKFNFTMVYGCKVYNHKLNDFTTDINISLDST